MKNFVFVLRFFVAIFVAPIFFICLFGVCDAATSGNPQKQVVQPGCFKRCTSANFNNADSVHITTYRGTAHPAKGLRIRPGVIDSGVVAIHPQHSYGADSIYYYYIGKSDIGYPLPFLFNKIYKPGTTLPLDSIEYFPDFP